MSKNIRWTMFALVACAVVAGAILWTKSRNKQAGDGDSGSTVAQRREDGSAPGALSGGRTALEGGSSKVIRMDAPRSQSGAPDYGTLPAISANATPQTRLAYEAMKTKNYPWRLSVAIKPPAFDVKKWADPDYRKAYLDEPAPARCYESAQPGKDIKPLQAACLRYITTKQGEPVELRVKGEPNMPVTFTSMDAAELLESKLATVTVAADDSGIAKVTLNPTKGVIDDCRVLAAGPMNSGQVQLTVHVLAPGMEPRKPTEDPTTLPIVPEASPSQLPSTK